MGHDAMIKITRIISMLLLLVLLTMILTSCFQGDSYTGDYPELFSVAIGSILGARGSEDVGGLRGSVEPGVAVLEEDDFGRVLFMYTEGGFSRRIDDDSERIVGRRVFVYLVAQRVDGNHVYFYPHYNFIMRGESGVRVFESYFEDIPLISNEDLNALKEANSWNQEMSDDTAFDRVRIVRRKQDGPVVTNEVQTDWMIYLRSDRYGRSVYAISSDYANFVYLFQPDNSLDWEAGFIEMTDLFNYQTELRLFMEANGWNTPWVEP